MIALGECYVHVLNPSDCRFFTNIALIQNENNVFREGEKLLTFLITKEDHVTKAVVELARKEEKL